MYNFKGRTSAILKYHSGHRPVVMPRPLDGIRVLDCGQIFLGSYCGLMLAYLGADVIKVEPPRGDRLRQRIDDSDPPTFQFLNANKRSVVLDLKRDDDVEKFKGLAEKSDVILHNFTPGTMEKFGLGYEDLRPLNPDLVYAHGSGYGTYGPYKDYPAMDVTIQAMSGAMDITGFEDGPPVKSGIAIADFMTGMNLALGIVSALFQREWTGEGQFVEVGMMDTMFPPLLGSTITKLALDKDVPPRTGNQHVTLSSAPYNSYSVTDGHVAIVCVSERQWENLLLVIGEPELVEEEKFSTRQKRANNSDEVDDLIQGWLEGKSQAEALERLREYDVPCAPVKKYAELYSDPHLKERNMIHSVPNETESEYQQLSVSGMPIKFSTSETLEVTHSPGLGEHTDEVLEQVLEDREVRPE